jgi:hypothetical protein
MSVLLPADAIDPRATRAAIAVLQGARTVRAVAAAIGVSSTAVAHLWLCKAKAAGLVAWEPGLAGTLRPCVSAKRRKPVTGG